MEYNLSSTIHTQFENFKSFYLAGMLRSEARDSIYAISLTRDGENKDILVLNFFDRKRNELFMKDEIVVTDEQALYLINIIRNNFIEKHTITLPTFSYSETASTGICHILENERYKLFIDINNEKENECAQLAQDYALRKHNQDVLEGKCGRPALLSEVSGHVKRLY